MISVSYLASVQFIPIGLAVIIFFTFPVLIMLASPMVEGKFPGFWRIIIAIFAFGGLVVAIGPSFGDLDIRGIGLATLASLAGVVQFFTGRSISRYLTPAVFGSLVHIVIWPATLLVALYVSEGTLQMMPGGTGTATGFYFLLGVAAVYVAAYMLQMSSLRFAPASTVAPFYNLEPIVTTAFAGLLFGETPDAQPICRRRHCSCRSCRIKPLGKAGKQGMNGLPIPVAILTGFLGAGKTSLLNALLKDEMLSNAAVIINEFGDVSLDHLLVEKSDENIIELASGCLCCTIRGDLIDTMNDLLGKRDRGEVKAFDRIVIETTGLADPAPVLHSVMSEPTLLERCRLEGVVTVVDAFNGWATLDAHAEAVKQVSVADRIVLTKVDLLSGREGEDMLFAIIARLRKLNPAARLLTTHRNEATAPRLFNMGLFDPEKKTVDVRKWLAAEAYETAEKRHRHHHHDVSRHDAHIRSFSFTEKQSHQPGRA